MKLFCRYHLYSERSAAQGPRPANKDPPNLEPPSDNSVQVLNNLNHSTPNLDCQKYKPTTTLILQAYVSSKHRIQRLRSRTAQPVPPPTLERNNRSLEGSAGLKPTRTPTSKAPQTRQESPRGSHCRPNESAIWIKFPPGSECINPNTVFLVQNASEQVNERTNEPTNPQLQIMSDQHHAPTSRSKPPPPGEEEASAVLKLGEFQDVDTLTLSEASLVINALMTKRRKDRKDRNETDVLNKTLDYLDAFARFKQKENVEAVERLLSARKELTKFERAQIGSLCCDSADECKTLIPSLADKITDDELQELLDEMAKLMST
ncbi:hypothetical protein GE21DRAFT_1348193 [Neurospora crassa]|nr:hypothetical protein GE21DRAFT_1348193 [Neurospora crassa]